MKYELLMFDLDGTITDSAEGIFNCFRYGLHAIGMDETDPEKLRPILGPSLYDSFTGLFGLNHEQATFAVKRYRERYTDVGLYENRVYDGVTDMLGRCRAAGYRIALATAKPEAFAVRIMDYFDLTRYFDFVTGASMDKSRDTKAAVIEHIFASMNFTDRSRAVMIGDRMHDLNGAAQCGVDAIGVLYGYGPREELEAHPHIYLADTPADIADFLQT